MRGWWSTRKILLAGDQHQTLENGGGRIVIDFSDDRDIDRFIEKFEKRGASAEIRNNK